MQIHWGRVLLAGFLIEVILAIGLVGGFAAAGFQLESDISTGASTIIGVACFVVGFAVVVWLGRGIDAHIVLHGVLMGLVATALYVGLVAGSGQMSTALAAYGPATFVIVNAARIAGAALGGVVCERRRAVRV